MCNSINIGNIYMSNHIKAKFFSLSYPKISNKEFVGSIEVLIKKLRRNYPTYAVKEISTIKIDLTDKENPSNKKSIEKELMLVDANGDYGLKINRESVSLSINGYVEYLTMVDHFEEVCNEIKGTLGIFHFSQVGIRNINVFSEDKDGYKDIKDRDIWGRQDFDSLNSNFRCSGAATRHEYISTDELKSLHIASSVVMEGRSYIPQDEWDIWNLRGEIPAIGEEAKLLIDLIGTHFQHSIREPEKKNKVSQFDWSEIKEQLKRNHDFVNSVYEDLTKD